MDIDRAYNKIQDFYDTNRTMPSYRQIADMVGYASKNAAYKLVDRLIEQGRLERNTDGKILPITTPGVQLLGVVEAGFPTPVDEQVLDTMSLDEWLVRDREATYMLEVKGDSMKDAGINPGDFVLVERTDNYKVGDIVVAYIDGQWTMKYLRKKYGHYYLEAANPKYPDLHPTENLSIEAVVQAVIRKMGAPVRRRHLMTS